MNCRSILYEQPVLLLLIPAVLAFFISLIPTIKYQWPLSGDIFYHIHLAKLYMDQGFVYWDPLTSAPFGRPISYPPLFHLLILAIGSLFGNIFQAARILQPILTMFIFISFSFVAYKLYKSILVGVSAGFFIFFSLVFQRFLLPLPENLALIMFPLAFYMIYLAFDKRDYKYAFSSGIIAGLMALTHILSAFSFVIATSVYSIIIGLKDKQMFFYGILLIIIAFSVAMIWWLPLLAKYGIILNVDGDIPNKMSIFKYPKFFGVFTLLFAIFGCILALKRRFKQDVMILIFLMFFLIVSNLNYLGFPIISNRILTFALFPLVVMAGVGFEFLKVKFEDKNVSMNFYHFFIISVYITAVATGFTMLVEVDEGNSWLRCSDPELDLAEWFQTHGDKKSVVVASNYRDSFIAALCRQPVALGGYGQGRTKSLDIQKYVDGKVNKSTYLKYNVGYFVLKKGMKAPPYTRLVYENKEFAIYYFISNAKISTNLMS